MKYIFALCVASILVNVGLSVSTAINIRLIDRNVADIKYNQHKGFIAQRVFVKCPKQMISEHGTWCFPDSIPNEYKKKKRAKKTNKIKLEEIGESVKPGPNDIVIGPKKIPDGGIITCESGSCVWIPGVEDGE